MKLLKTAGTLMSVLFLSVLFTCMAEARHSGHGHHSRHCRAHKHVDIGTGQCVWNYGYKKYHK